MIWHFSSTVYTGCFFLLGRFAQRLNLIKRLLRNFE